MKKLLLFALTGLALTTACKKDNGSDTPATMQLSGKFSTDQEVPVTTTTSNGSGTVTGTYNPTSKVLNYTITYSGITATSGHIHYSDARHYNRTPVFAFTDLTSPIKGTVTLERMQADSLLAGHMYANLHTVACPAGELRANLTVK